MKIDNRITKVIYTHQQIVDRCKELGKWIDQEYKNSNDLILVALMKGSLPFLAELIKHITIDHIIDFMTVSSFGGTLGYTGKVKIVTDLHSNIKDKDILIIEEMVDSGRTLDKIIKTLKVRDPKSIKVLTLLYKKGAQIINIKVDKYGFLAPNLFYAGFGLDVKEKLRNLPYIGIFDKTKINQL